MDEGLYESLREDVARVCHKHLYAMPPEFSDSSKGWLLADLILMKIKTRLLFLLPPPPDQLTAKSEPLIGGARIPGITPGEPAINYHLKVEEPPTPQSDEGLEAQITETILGVRNWYKNTPHVVKEIISLAQSPLLAKIAELEAEFNKQSERAEAAESRVNSLTDQIREWLRMRKQSLASLEQQLAECRKERDQYKKMAEDWTTAADAAQQPEQFYEEYSEKTMQVMQALLAKAREDLTCVQESYLQMAAERDYLIQLCLLRFPTSRLQPRRDVNLEMRAEKAEAERDELKAQLAAEKPVGGEPTRFAWLIERRGNTIGAVWWCAGSERWTRDANKAIQFPDKESAEEAYMLVFPNYSPLPFKGNTGDYEDIWDITEHGFMPKKMEDEK